MSKKIGFWSVFELVTISQIGSGLMLPANLAPYGNLSLIAWVISSIGALVLALMFAQLCKHFPRTGGPHAYVQEAFGDMPAFFTGWTYWVISWVSTIAIVTSAVGYLTPFIGEQSSVFHLTLEVLILTVITAINFRGVYAAGKTKCIFVVLKMIPLLLVPVLALFYFDAGNFANLPATSEEMPSLLNNVVLLTLWGFIGFETATTVVDEVNRPTQIIPKALILGTLFVSIVYFISSLGLMGAIPSDILMHSKAPYTDVAKWLFGGHWYLFVSLIAAIICIGAVNAWTLACGQIALGITQEGLMPAFFAKQNKYGAPYVALLISFGCSIPILFLTHTESIAEKVNTIIDFSVASFLFVYIVVCFAYLRLLWQKERKGPLWQWLCGLFSLGFCLWVIFATPVVTLLVSSLFVLSGIPVYLLQRGKSKRSRVATETVQMYS